MITPTAKGRTSARCVHRHLADLEHAVARRVTSDDLKAFMKVVSVVEAEAHRRPRAGAKRRR